MKKLATLSVLLVLGYGAQAEEIKFTNADGSDLSAVCISALESLSSARQLAREKQISLEELACNGLPLQKFVQKFSEPKLYAPKSYVFRKADNTVETELCLAAVTSSQRYTQLKQQHFSEIESVEDTVQCNDLSLRTFMLKFRNQRLTVNR